MLKGYWWIFVTIPVLALAFFYINVLVGKKLTKEGVFLPKNFFIWATGVVLGLILFLEWLLNPRSRYLVNLICSLIFMLGGLGRIIMDWKELRKRN